MSYASEERLSNTGMGYLKRSPAHYRYWREHQSEGRRSSALELGIAVHMAILEPDRFTNEYEAMPDVSHLTPGQKAGVTKAFKAMPNTGKIMLPYDQYQTILGIKNAVDMAGDTIGDLLQGDKEYEYFWVDYHSNALCKGRFDVWNSHKKYLLDLKTTENAEMGAFIKSIYKYSLHRQAAFYMDAAKADNFYWLAVEKVPPFGVGIYHIDRECSLYKKGRDEYQELCEVYKECVDSNIWPGYNTNKAVTLANTDSRIALSVDSETGGWLD
jgi:hypothetical protein